MSGATKYIIRVNKMLTNPNIPPLEITTDCIIQVVLTSTNIRIYIIYIKI